MLCGTRSALVSFGVFDGVHSDRASLLQFSTQARVLGFQAHHSTNTLKVHSLVGELRDSAEHLDVGVAVTTIAALGTRRHD